MACASRLLPGILRRWSLSRAQPICVRASSKTISGSSASFPVIRDFPGRRSFSAKPEVTFTSERYPNVRRGNFGRVEDADVAFFRRLLPDGERVVTEEAALEGVNIDWLRMVRGQSKLLLKPRTTQEVAAILR